MASLNVVFLNYAMGVQCLSCSVQIMALVVTVRLYTPSHPVSESPRECNTCAMIVPAVWLLINS